MAPGSDPEPGVLTFAGGWGTRLRLDGQVITYRNFLRTRRIGWDQVRWMTDGSWGQNARWVLRIVLHDGREIDAAATVGGGPHPEKLAAIRQTAAQHAVPAVLTGTPVNQGQPIVTTAGLYIDPGGKLGLREWTGTEWSPFLYVDPASSGPGGESAPATVWSPLPEPEQQRQWDAAATRARRARIWVAAILGATVVAAAAMLLLAVFVYHLGQPDSTAAWLGSGLVCLVCIGGGATGLAGVFRHEFRKVEQAAKKAAQLARAEDTSASPVDDRGGDPAAGAPVTGQPPAADLTAGAGRVSCRECGSDSDRATRVCARCGAPLLPLSSL